jgi:A/G-specific adenine glycosylase
VLDGNVARVMARLLNNSGDIASARVKAGLLEEAQHVLDDADPGLFNQAMMELGATVCLPKEPRCGDCPLRSQCEARRCGTERQLPVKLRRTAPVVIERTLLVIEQGGRLLMWQRPPDKRMAGFWELPEAEMLPAAEPGEAIGCFRHAVMNRNYRFTVVRSELRAAPEGFGWVSPSGSLLSTTARKALALR